MWLRLADAGARFATTTAHTCTIELSSDSRRHQLGSRFALVLGRYPDAATAHRAQARLADPKIASGLDRVERGERKAWYEAQADALVLPAGVVRADIDGLVDAVPTDDFASFTAVVPQPGGGAVLAQPLLCGDPSHASRVRATLERRFPATLTAFRRVLAPSSQAA
jgi:hypothetical protein